MVLGMPFLTWYGLCSGIEMISHRVLLTLLEKLMEYKGITSCHGTYEAKQTGVSGLMLRQKIQVNLKILTNASRGCQRELITTSTFMRIYNFRNNVLVNNLLHFSQKVSHLYAVSTFSFQEYLRQEFVIYSQCFLIPHSYSLILWRDQLITEQTSI